jgi:DNA-binding response OmpR family regulator
VRPIHILVAEDDTNLRNGLVDLFESEGYEITPACNGEEALELFSRGRFDMVILDIMMPVKSGYDVCREIRSIDEEVPIIMLTAKGEEIDKVVGLQLGADDYVTKPFGVFELLARITAVLRRSKRAREMQGRSVGRAPGSPTGGDAPDCFSFGPAEIDVRRFRGRLGDRVFDLSAREIKLLRFFLDHAGQVLSRDQLLNVGWGVGYFGTTRTLDQHIAQLRKKIEPNPKEPRVITTVHTIGYRYEG